MAGGDDAAAEKAKYGITDDFVRQVGGMIHLVSPRSPSLAETDRAGEGRRALPGLWRQGPAHDAAARARRGSYSR